jgi:hypothetical protein
MAASYDDQPGGVAAVTSGYETSISGLEESASNGNNDSKSNTTNFAALPAISVPPSGGAIRSQHSS